MHPSVVNYLGRKLTAESTPTWPRARRRQSEGGRVALLSVTTVRGVDSQSPQLALLPFHPFVVLRSFRRRNNPSCPHLEYYMLFPIFS